MFRCFQVSNFRYDHEIKTFKIIFEKLKNKYNNSNQNFNLIIQPNILGSTPDLIIISNKLIAVADIKSGAGTITGNENSRWYSNGLEINKERENPFQQIFRYKFDLLNFLKDKLHFYFPPDFIDSNINLGHIKGFVIFDNVIYYDHSQLQTPTRKWFKVTSALNFHKDIDSLPASMINLSDPDIETIIFKILKIDPSQYIDNYPLPEFVEPSEVTLRKVNIPIKINIPQLYSKHQKILSYYRYCLVLEDLKSSEIPESSIAINLTESPLALSSFSTVLTPDLKIFLDKQSFYSRAQNIQLLLAYPVFDLKDSKVPLFISTTNFSIKNSHVIFSISDKYEISKTFISRVMGISDPEQIEFIKSNVDKSATIDEKIDIIIQNFNPEKSSISIDTLKKELSSYRVLLFWGTWGTNFKVIRELEDIIKKGITTQELSCFISQSQIDNTPHPENLSLLIFSNLNKEQELALESAFTKRLTVVTGPPGTGKTQISFNIMANAVIHGKTVLFSTKNNKAVDDVCKKFEKLFPNNSITPLIRVGNKEVISRLPDKILKTINTINNNKTIDQNLINKVKIDINIIKEKINELESEISKFYQLQLYYNSIKNQIEFNKSLYEFEKLNKSKIIENLNFEKENILSSIPKPFIDFFYEMRKNYPTPESLISKHLSALTDKLLGKLNLLEKIILLINKKYIYNKYTKIFAKLSSAFDPPQIEFIKKMSKTLPDLFKYLLLAKSWEKDIAKVIDIDEKIKERESELENIKNEFEKLIADLERKLVKLKDDISKLAPKIKQYEEEIESLKSTLIEKSKDYLRLFYISSLTPNLVPSLQSFKTSIENSTIISKSAFKEILKAFPIIATTNLSVANVVPLEPYLFDILIIDEASQSDIASALPLILRSKNIVIIGDPMQLKHISGLSNDEDATIAQSCDIPEFKLNYSNKSLYLLAEEISNKSANPVIFLTEHYRSYHKIIEFSNSHFYSHIGRELVVKTPPENIKFKKINGIIWIPTQGTEKNKINTSEAEKIEEILLKLKNYIDPDISIGITTPFRNQADFLQRYLYKLLRPGIDVVDTVHRFQGDEKDIMFLSLVVSPNSESSLLWFINESAKQLLNVAVTRARSSLFVIGDYNFAISPNKSNRFRYDYIRALAESSICGTPDDLL